MAAPRVSRGKGKKMSNTIPATNKAEVITVKQTVDRSCCAIWQKDDVIIVDRSQARRLVKQILNHLGLDDVEG